MITRFLDAFMTPYVRVKPVLAGSGNEKHTDALGNELDKEAPPEVVVYNHFYVDMTEFIGENRPIEDIRVSYVSGESDVARRINHKDLLIWAKENSSDHAPLEKGYAVIVKSKDAADDWYEMKRIDAIEGNSLILTSSGKKGVETKKPYSRSDIIGRVVASIPYDEKYTPTEKPVSFSKDIRTIYKWGSPAS